MNHKVGQKGQIVIEKRIRDKLGVKPGWQALQLLVGDHVEVYFVPPEHNRSLGADWRGMQNPNSIPKRPYEWLERGAGQKQHVSRRSFSKTVRPFECFYRHERPRALPDRKPRTSL